MFALQVLGDFEESLLAKPKDARAAHALACRFLRRSFRAKGLSIEPPPFPRRNKTQFPDAFRGTGGYPRGAGRESRWFGTAPHRDRAARRTPPNATSGSPRSPGAPEKIKGARSAPARDLQAIRFRLQGVAWNLFSDSPSEEERGGEERPPSFAAQARAAIDCVVADCLIPARHDLEAAARYVPEEGTHPSLKPRPGFAGSPIVELEERKERDERE